jgi:mRNA-degrading endonuclease RelE of RelBE toxin-antitoxin system
MTIGTAETRRVHRMAAYQIEMTEDARTDLAYYTAFERKIIVSELRDQLTHQPSVATRNRKALRDNPIARWELRVDRYRIFYEVDEESHLVIIVAVGHKDHEVLLFRGRRAQL